MVHQNVKIVIYPFQTFQQNHKSTNTNWHDDDHESISIVYIDPIDGLDIINQQSGSITNPFNTIEFAINYFPIKYGKIVKIF